MKTSIINLKVEVQKISDRTKAEMASTGEGCHDWPAKLELELRQKIAQRGRRARHHTESLAALRNGGARLPRCLAGPAPLPILLGWDGERGAGIPSRRSNRDHAWRLR
jgi:hypothetical protein